MRKLILVAATAFVVGGAATGAVVATAQPAPPPGGPGADAPPPPHHHPHGPWGWRGAEGRGPHHANMNNFALVYRHEDRNLSPQDVQKIAEAFLLWQGNHTWKVTDVATTANGAVGFSLATQQGGTVAKFTMDPHSGKVTRVD